MMRIFPTYFFYLARRTLVGVAGLFVIIWMLVVSVDLIESMREVGKVEGAGLIDALKMTLFRTPQLILTLSPFIFLFGTLWAFGQMARTSEVAVMRAAGLSVWKLVAPPALLAVIIGLFTVIAIDPVAADFASRAQTIKNEIRGKDANMIRQLQDGVWLRQQYEDRTAVIHAVRYLPTEDRLIEVTVWNRTPEGTFLERWDAPSATVAPGEFTLIDAERTTLRGGSDPAVAAYNLPVSIDLRALREDIALPEALSVWQIPTFAEVMSSAGMPVLSYQIRYHDLWSLPARLAAMVLIASAVALGIQARSGGIAALMGLGIAAGFILFIISELSTAVAEAQIVPIGLAAWAPAAFAILFALTFLLYREDG